MAKIRAFKGLRYNIDKIGSWENVVTPPYDVVSAKQQDMFYEKSPYSVMRLELNKETPADNEQDNRYTRAKACLDEWIKDGVLEFEKEEAIYLYEEEFSVKEGETKSFKGFMTLTQLVPFSEKVVLPHEETLSKAKEDRFRLMSATDSNFSPIYCLYMDKEKELVTLIDEISKSKPQVDFVDGEGITQRLWVVTDKDLINRIVKGFADKQLFIADGHHRYETALRYAQTLREKTGDTDPEALFNYCMMMLVEMDDPGLVVLPTHRLVHNLKDFDIDKTIEKLKENFDVEKIECKDENTDTLSDKIETGLYDNKDKTVFAMYVKNAYYLITLKNNEVMKQIEKDKSAAYCDLDVAVLHTLILDKIMGIDSKDLANQTFLTYTKQASEALSEVDNGNYQCSFILNPTKVSQIKDVSLANDKMPQKSTYFYPKLITGLVMNKFRD